MTDKQIIDSKRYNAERKAQAELMKRDLERDKMLAQLYQESYDRMQAQIDQFYMAYAGKEGLTRQEAVKRASEMDVTKFNAKAARAVKEKDFSHSTNEWLKVYNLKMKVSRLELLKAELALEIQNLTAEANEVFDKARYDELTNEFKRQSGILGNSATRAPKRLEAILDADFYGQKFSDRVWGGLGLQANLQRDVFGSLNRIYTDMMGYKRERNRLAKKFGTSKANAQRLLKTEIARINADTQLAMLKENKFTHMIFVAEPGACDICGPLDQKAIPIDEVEKGVNMFPMHPNCRCSAYGRIKMDYKAGGSTLDEYEVWRPRTKNVEPESRKQITSEVKKLLTVSKDEIFEAGAPEEIDFFFEKQQSYQKWYNEVEQSESKKGSLGRYTSHEHDRMNALLREGKEVYERNRGKYAFTDSVKSDIDAVKSAISGFKTENSFKTYRGISFYGEDKYSNLKVENDVVLDKAFMSSSLDKNEINMFADGGIEYRFEITVPKGYSKGAYISGFSGMPEEKEFLFLPDARFDIKSVTRNGNVVNVMAEALND